jgi:cysteinyl-tRNA synthetase
MRYQPTSNWLARNVAAAIVAAAAAMPSGALRPDPALGQTANIPAVPAPKPAQRPQQAVKPPAPDARAERLKRINAVTSWGYQLASLSIETAASSPYGLLVVDATAGLESGKPFTRADVERLKRAPDGSRRLVVSYLSVGEAEDYRPDYFSPEYLEEEAPDWLLKENPQWKGNRLIRFCLEGWQKTILGDEQGRNVYASTLPSPLYRLIELGFDGVYLDRVDVYAEIEKECPDGARKMVDFVARLATHARKADPNFLVILQNAEALLDNPKMVETIDAVAKESLFFGEDFGQKRNPADTTNYSLKQLRRAKSAGRAIFVVDYVTDRSRASEAVALIRAQGFVPYIGPRDLARMWLPGSQF